MGLDCHSHHHVKVLRVSNLCQTPISFSFLTESVLNTVTNASLTLLSLPVLNRGFGQAVQGVGDTKPPSSFSGGVFNGHILPARI